jgi:enolase
MDIEHNRRESDKILVAVNKLRNLTSEEIDTAIDAAILAHKSTFKVEKPEYTEAEPEEWRKEHAIQYFTELKKQWGDRYIKRDLISIKDVLENKDFVDRCDWAINKLKGL